MTSLVLHGTLQWILQEEILSLCLKYIRLKNSTRWYVDYFIWNHCELDKCCFIRNYTQLDFKVTMKSRNLHEIRVTDCNRTFLHPLRAKYFRGYIKYIFPSYIITQYWHDTGNWNPPSSKTKTYLCYIVNIMGADVLATQGARASAPMILTMSERIDSVLARYHFCRSQWHVHKQLSICMKRRLMSLVPGGFYQRREVC